MYTNQKCDNKDRKDRLTAPSIITTALLVEVIGTAGRSDNYRSIYIIIDSCT